MAVSTGTYCYNGLTLSAATGIWTDPDLTIVAADGWYQEAGIWRELTGGVLGPPQSCPNPCPVPCTSVINASDNQGQFTLTINMGTAVGACILVFQPYGVPDRCQWTYDGVSASEYSSAIDGYLQGVIGNETNALACGTPPSTSPITNALGSSGATYVGAQYVWDTSINDFVATSTSVLMGPYLNQAAGGTSLSAAGTPGPGPSMMVVPKPNAFPYEVTITVDGPCGGTLWELDINCPQKLNQFSSGAAGGSCSSGLTDYMYTAHVYNTTGVSSTISVHDWAFSDADGVTAKPAGTYPVSIGGVTNCVTVSSDGVVTNVASCFGSC
jgi:hypothetical protein